MTIQEAIKSGKPFKRKNWYKQNWYNFQDHQLILMRTGEAVSFAGDDIIAEDWEIKEEPKGPREWTIFIKDGQIVSSFAGPAEKIKVKEVIE